MSTAVCPDRQTLEQLLLGKLPPAEQEALSEHLLHCDSCAISADTLLAEDEVTKALLAKRVLQGDEVVLNRAIARGKALRSDQPTVFPDGTRILSNHEEVSQSPPVVGLTISRAEIDFLAPAQQPDELGRLGEYRILQVLGSGGMGVVFRAEDPRLKRQVALKAMKPAIASNGDAKSRFVREAQFTAALEHDNIVHIYQVGEDRGVPFIAMQFLHGESLKARLERIGRLPQPEVIRIGKEIAAGLAAAHKRGLIHRDIKPDNIWLEAETDRVKILDFGLVRAADDDAGLTQSGMVMGTPRYMAPEQAQGHSVDHRCDLFSLGSVLYHLAAGQPPFGGNNLTATLMAVVQQAPAPLTVSGAEISSELEALILRLLSKDRAQRPQVAADVCASFAELERVLHQPREPMDSTLESQKTAEFPPTALPGGKTVPQPARSSGSGRRWSLKSRALAAVAGAALLLAGVIIITITNTDGTKTIVEVPSDSKIDVAARPDPQPSTLNLRPNGWHGWPADAPKPAIAPFDAAQAKRHQEAWAAYLKIPVEYTNSIGMKFRLIPPGEFTMGSTAAEIEAALKDVEPSDKHWQGCIKSEAPQHKVLLTQPIYLGVNEVTQAEYEQVMGVNPSHFTRTGMGTEVVAGLATADHPVEMVSWNDAAGFCAKLSQQEQLKPFYFRGGETVTPLGGTGYRLPSEAEWEFACRAGTATKYWIGDQDQDLVRAGWFGGESAGWRTHAAGELKANPFGLYDIHGNVWEWVQDGWDANYYSEFLEKAAINPSAPFSAGSERVVRGGRWYFTASPCRSSSRDANSPTSSNRLIGFRVSLPVDAVKAAVANGGGTMAATKTGWHGWPADAPKPAVAPFDAAQAKRHQEAWAAYLKIPVEHTNSLGMKFRLIPPGEFTMGSTAAEIEAALKEVGDDKRWQERIKSAGPQHKVILTQPIYLGVSEVTQAEYETVMGTNPSHFAPMGMGKEAVAGLETAEHPVEMVSWNDAAEFCAKLSQQEKLKPFYFRAGETITPLDGTGYRLPSEAEWEFACRAGTTTKYWIGDKDEDLGPAGWFGGNSGRRTHAAGELKANPFGLSDIHSNVWERVQDGWDATWYGQFQEQPAINPSSPFSAGSQRVIRGGHWGHPASYCRSSNRDANNPTSSGPDIGFRLSLVAVGSRVGRP